MGAFKTSELLHGNPYLIPQIGEKMAEEFGNDGYAVATTDLATGGKEISITKGGLFKAIIGMRTALKIKLEPAGDMMRFDAGVGIFGLQAIPTAITLFVTWPVLLTQIWGLIRQSELDDKALEIAKKAIRDLAHANCLQEPDLRCPHDGCRIPANSAYCPYCGAKIK